MKNNFTYDEFVNLVTKNKAKIMEEVRAVDIIFGEIPPNVHFNKVEIDGLILYVGIKKT